MGIFKTIKKIDAKIVTAVDKAAPGGNQRRRRTSTSEKYCISSRCKHFANEGSGGRCQRPCCVNIREGFTEGGTHNKDES